MTENLETEDKKTHENHRKRLRTKILNYGLECLEYHEILEHLLTYTIARKDTNPIAHRLLEHFGSFSNVIEADFYDLQKVKGVGAESALLINTFGQMMDIYRKSKMEQQVTFLKNPSNCVQFFREYYRIKNNEFMVVACLSKNKKLVKTYVCNGIDETQISFDLRTILNNLDKNVKSLVLYHTHPNGDVQPSETDIATTQTVLNMCLMHGVDCDDHIILNESDHYSFKNEGLIVAMKSKYNSVFEYRSIYNKTLKTSKNNSKTTKN